MKALHPAAKVGLIFLGLVIAVVLGWFAIDLRQLATQGPDAQAASGMYAFGDLVLGIAVFGIVALVPLSLALYWLRTVERFWAVLLSGTKLWAAAGLCAVAAHIFTNRPANFWMLLALGRIILMPLSALALLLCAIFAPRPRHRWLLLAAALTDGVIITIIFFALIVLPNLGGR